MPDLIHRPASPGRAGQVLGLLLIGCGLFLLVSLATYSSGDYPNSSRAPGDVTNRAGRFGAQVSSSVYIGMGYAGYLLPLLCLLWGVNRVARRPAAEMRTRTVGLLGMALVYACAVGLPMYSRQTAFRLGGWLAVESSRLFFVPYAGRIGSAILLTALFLAALVLTVDLRLAPLAAAWRGLRGTFGSRRQPAVTGPASSGGRSEPGDNEPEEDDSPAAPLPLRAKGGFGVEAAVRGARTPATEAGEPADASEEELAADDSELPMADDDPLASVLDDDDDDDTGQTAAGPPPVVRSASPSAADDHPARSRLRATGKYRLPSPELLDPVPATQGEVDRDALVARARMLEDAMRNFDVGGRVVEVGPGPVVTRYEVEPAAGVKVNRIVTLADDLARIMSATGIRIQAPVPGRSVVGVEIANPKRETVYLREILESKAFRQAESRLTMALGKTISGEPYVADLARMPHLLVAGATGSGKSVCINCLICSLLVKATPDEVRLLMVDPKVVELTMYADIPHLLTPVITEPKRASEALKWAVAEMEVRYQKLAKLGVRNLADYNRKLARLHAQTDPEGTQPETPIPYVVVVIDEFADLMLTAPADVETSLMSLAQKSRAVGIHIILATQRPSVNVITGVIKANFPSRIAFQVASKVDSRTILDMNGAERLLGRGDMLFLPGGQGEPIRVHGAYVSGEETERLVEVIKANRYTANQVAVFSDHGDISSSRESQDELFDQAVRLVVDHQQASTSFLQRRMKVGYSRAARLMDQLQNAGVVGPADGAKPREILITAEDLAEDDTAG
jgi:S-DNA-T family DNA segregation ATPase FtsK/SpoIIIE